MLRGYLLNYLDPRKNGLMLKTIIYNMLILYYL